MSQELKTTTIPKDPTLFNPPPTAKLTLQIYTRGYSGNTACHMLCFRQRPACGWKTDSKRKKNGMQAISDPRLEIQTIHPLGK